LSILITVLLILLFSQLPTNNNLCTIVVAVLLLTTINYSHNTKDIYDVHLSSKSENNLSDITHILQFKNLTEFDNISSKISTHYPTAFNCFNCKYVWHGKPC